MPAAAMASKSWHLGQGFDNNHLKHLELSLDALSAFPETGVSELITQENVFIIAFLRHFPPQDLMSVLYSLTVRLSSKPLPSRRSRQQLLSELKQLLCVSSSLGAMALQNHSRDVGQSQFTIPNMAVPYHHISVPSHVLGPGNNSMALQNHWRDAGQSQSPELKCDHSEWTNS